MSLHDALDQLELPLLPDVPADRVSIQRHDPIDEATLALAAEFVDDVALNGDEAVRRRSEELGDLGPGEALVFERAELDQALHQIDPRIRGLLERTAERIRIFAQAQLGSISELTVTVPSGRAGHRCVPLASAGCYAPAGRYPLPSSLLMTTIPARVAGVETVVAASPHPQAIMKAAAAVAGADLMLAVGGAQAIGAMAHGTASVPKCDTIVGPGNRWVTAAKQYVSRRVAIDMLAGPSELLVLADETADAELIAADLIAQAEHDVDAWPALGTTSAKLVPAVRAALARQLEDLPTQEIARDALTRGAAVVVEDRAALFELADVLAVEHVQVMMRDPDEALDRLRNYGALFLGEISAEVFGDYGVGPNHTLPTGGAARHAAGLSVFNFIRLRTWLSNEDAVFATNPRTGSPGARRNPCAKNDSIRQPAAVSFADLISDVALFARVEGLEGHARAAEMRRRFT